MTPLDLLGWASGGLVMISGLPAIVANMRTGERPKPSLARDSLQLAGNLGWVAYGALNGTTPIAAMCALNSLFMLILITQQLRRAAGERRTVLHNAGKGSER